MGVKLRQRRRLMLLGCACFVVFVLCVVSNHSTSPNKNTNDSVREVFEGLTVSQRIEEILSFVTGGTKGRSQNDFKKILLWTPFFGIKDYIQPWDKIGCPDVKCTVTSNRSQLLESDAVVLHLRDLDIKDLPKSRKRSQRWVLLHHESPHNTPDILKPLEGLINWTVTYRQESDIFLSPRPHRLETPRPLPETNFNQKKRMIAWLVSNCRTDSNREAFVTSLRKTVPVDIYGSCGDKQCLPKMSKECLHKLEKEYRFYLSFENSICRDYVTEKLFDILDTTMVPVVLGGADYEKLVPPNSYIDALKFESPRHLGKYLLDVAKNDTMYNHFFQWKKFYEMRIEHYACTLCKKLHDSTEPPSIYRNLHKWWFEEAHCRSWKPKE